MSGRSFLCSVMILFVTFIIITLRCESVINKFVGEFLCQAIIEIFRIVLPGKLKLKIDNYTVICGNGNIDFKILLALSFPKMCRFANLHHNH